ncbi:hypothetical protein NA56DRAFT_347334 [Hyaloscypha hepaticicola]|uniref:Uncharacterized protein n=1 Tax=Hyaloscypha hepaticicola TaxID=2082293 RepID=A0A2J6PN32_9HELO|nr:hypothetical protein NA56DRAFT_347334 [Hyaloscypha hepaticicola]
MEPGGACLVAASLASGLPLIKFFCCWTISSALMSLDPITTSACSKPWAVEGISLLLTSTALIVASVCSLGLTAEAVSLSIPGNPTIETESFGCFG